jgi:hypothetical protein
LDKHAITWWFVRTDLDSEIDRTAQRICSPHFHFRRSTVGRRPLMATWAIVNASQTTPAVTCSP